LRGVGKEIIKKGNKMTEMKELELSVSKKDLENLSILYREDNYFAILYSILLGLGVFWTLLAV